MTDDREKLIEEMARTLCWKNGMNPGLTLGGDGQNFLWHEYVDAAKAALSVAEKALAEKHARIAEEAGVTMDEYICVLCDEIAAAIRAAAIKETGNE